ncbi:sensor histidine kinase [Caproiciproducens sp.]|uniref:sensor histidine kinase n=1 Tax=Caproiciproducens sp. TaxID=1954376 RepID=UPI00289714CC|nr:sensor histidine kinase [Caproiciproducens sp.]
MISLLILFFMTLVSFISYQRYSDYFTESTKVQTQQTIEQISINVDTYLSELLRLSLSPYYNNSIMEDLESQPKSAVEKLEMQRKVETFLGSVMILPREDILRVYILTGNAVYSNIKTPFDMENYTDYTKANWYRQAVSTQKQIFLPVRSEKVFGNVKTQIFSIVQGLRSKKDSSVVLGVIKVDANYAGIKSICDKVELEPDSALLILDSDKNIIYKGSRFTHGELGDAIYSKALAVNGSSLETITNKQYVLNTSTLKTTGWKVVEIHSYDALNYYFSQTRNAAFLLAMLCSFFAVLILFLFANSFLKPLLHVVNRMKLVEKGDLTVQIPVKTHDEIGYLTDSFNTMVSQLQTTMVKNTQLVKEVYEMNYLQKEAQYNALCSQIKPHFLYNTLNTISLLIKCGENQQAVSDIEKLSYYLRGVMNTDKDITLAAEIKIIEAYLGLQKSRYGEKLAFYIEIPESIRDYRIPALSLQPIVENAIIHGCEFTKTASSIRLGCRTENDLLLISIIDNGKGIDKLQLEDLNRSLKNSHPDPQHQLDIFEKSIGLLNVNSRLQLKFGAEYGVFIESVINEGTCVTVKLPLNSDEGGNPDAFRHDC